MNCMKKKDLKELSNIILFALLLVMVTNCSKNNKDASIDKALLDKNEKLMLNGKKEESIELNKKLIKISKKNKYEKGEALGYINLATTYRTLGKYKVSSYYLKLAQGLAIKLQDDFIYTKLYYEYAWVNSALGLSTTGLNYNTKALKYALKLNERSSLLGDIYGQRAGFFIDKKSDSALIYFHKGFDVDPSALNSSLIGRFHLKVSNNLDSATFYNKNALILLKRKEYGTIREGIIYSFYGGLLLKKKEYLPALEYYEKASTILKKTQSINMLPEIYRNISIIYKSMNNKNKENEYVLKYTQLNDNLKMAGNEAIDISINKYIEKESNNESTSTFMYLLIGSIIFIIAIIFSFLKIRKNRLKKQISLSPFEPEENTSKERKDEITNENFTELIDLAKSNDLKLINRFQEIHPDLFLSLLKINPQLTKSELSLCVMIWLGFSSKEIANFTFMQHRSVHNKTGRLRKKLNIQQGQNIHNFLKSI
ncbi:hypothetical protein SAMN06265171_106100 [Chryseobacterium rhizoplanae]|uniref:HTH luxR-type domain-containing protein n=2 Tax=Chryseobacterium rhizoplanae TaxID=1609531 RepID=A0A521DU30_9FLAO|nr:hypothetical protein SAMN06265171_106100 [Chryseobacterium rhizoplanae]